MQLKLDKRFWVVITCIIVVFTIFIVGRNLLHAIEIRKDIAILEQERAIYRARIEQDSTPVSYTHLPKEPKAAPASKQTSAAGEKPASEEKKTEKTES